MTLGSNRKLLLEKLVQLADDLNCRNKWPCDDDPMLHCSAAAADVSSVAGGGCDIDVSWQCRIELIVFILNQLTTKDLDVLLNVVTMSNSTPTTKSTHFNNATSFCVLLNQVADHHVLMNDASVSTHVFMYKMLVDPNVESENDLQTSCAFSSNCCASFYNNKQQQQQFISSLCINPSHYEKRGNSCTTDVTLTDQSLDQVLGSSPSPNFATSVSAVTDDLGDKLQSDKLERRRNSAISRQKTPIRCFSNAPNCNSVPLSDSSNAILDQYSTCVRSPGRDPNFDDAAVSVAGCTHYIVEYEPVRSWCSVAYYEGENQMGEVYHAVEHTFQIDGLPDQSSSHRFCLGLINRELRESVVIQVRRAIDRGVKFYWSEDCQEFHVECLSKHAVFFQSHCYNVERNFEPHSVVKIPPGSTACVFRLETFTEAIQSNLKVEVYDYNTVYNMSTMCNVRISFIKGWGASYKRAKITQCPCWIDVTLNAPLHMLDKVLRYLHPPPLAPSSGSGGKNSPVEQYSLSSSPAKIVNNHNSSGRNKPRNSLDMNCLMSEVLKTRGEMPPQQQHPLLTPLVVSSNEAPPGSVLTSGSDLAVVNNDHLMTQSSPRLLSQSLHVNDAAVSCDYFVGGVTNASALSSRNGGCGVSSANILTDCSNSNIIINSSSNTNTCSDSCDQVRKSSVENHHHQHHHIEDRFLSDGADECGGDLSVDNDLEIMMLS